MKANAIAPGGTLDLLVYHGRDYEFINGDPLNDPNRHTRVQAVLFDEDGMPIFGEPLPNGPVVLGAAP